MKPLKIPDLNWLCWFFQPNGATALLKGKTLCNLHFRSCALTSDGYWKIEWVEKWWKLDQGVNAHRWE
jgi:hypothetical protein